MEKIVESFELYGKTYRFETGELAKQATGAVLVTQGETTVLELRVAPEDMGKLIGRQGRIAKEIRTIVKSVAQRNGQKVSVEIVD